MDRLLLNYSNGNLLSNNQQDAKGGLGLAGIRARDDIGCSYCYSNLEHTPLMCFIQRIRIQPQLRSPFELPSNLLDGEVWDGTKMVRASEYNDKDDDEFLVSLVNAGISLFMTLAPPIVGGVPINFSSVPQAMNTIEKVVLPLMRGTAQTLEIVGMVGYKLGKGEKYKTLADTSRNVKQGLNVASSVADLASPKPDEMGTTGTNPVGGLTNLVGAGLEIGAELFERRTGKDAKPYLIPAGFVLSTVGSTVSTFGSPKSPDELFSSTIFTSISALECFGVRFPSNSTLKNFQRASELSAELNKLKKSMNNAQ